LHNEKKCNSAGGSGIAIDVDKIYKGYQDDFSEYSGIWYPGIPTSHFSCIFYFFSRWWNVGAFREQRQEVIGDSFVPVTKEREL